MLNQFSNFRQTSYAITAAVRISLVSAQLFAALGVASFAGSSSIAVASTTERSLVLAPAAGDITGTVFNDSNGNGTREGTESGVSGITVTAFGNGTSINTTTDASGAYTLTVAGNDARVEFTGFAGYQSSPVGANSNTSVRFVPAPSSSVNFGIFRPTDFCQNNPNILVTCFVFGSNVTGTTQVQNNRTVLSYPYNATGTNTALQVPEALARQTGSVYGVGYQRTSKFVFVSAYTKRATGYGPGTGSATSDGTGTVYMFKAGTPADAVPFVDLDDLFGASTTGNDPHTGFTLLPGNFDNGAYAAVGKVGLGDIDVSEDDRTLWVVNMANQKLYGLPVVLNAALTPITPTAAQVSSTDIPNPGCVNGAARPFAVKPYNGLVYVGGVCDATSGTNSDLQAYVYAFNPATNTWGASPVLQFPLNYPRNCIDVFPTYPNVCKNTTNGSQADWRPWRDTLDTTFPAGFAEGFTAHPQPMLSDIEFVGGDMVIAFRDRFPDQIGFEDPGPQRTSPRGFLLSALPGGDVLRAGLNATNTWTIENNSQSNPSGRFGPTAGAGTGEGPGGGEFYMGEELTTVHDETALGALAFAPIFTNIVATAVDPIRAVTAGTIQLNNTDGTQTRAYEVYAPPPAPASANNFRKANGLGDLELLCDAAPIEIGDRVWLDANSNGIQDPGEAPLANIAVRLTDSLGTVVTATTDANGEYRFSNAAGTNTPSAIYGLNTGAVGSVTLTPFGSYTLTIDLAQPNLASYSPAPPNADPSANGTARDSNGIQTGTAVNVPVVLGGPGFNNHTYDFGFAPLVLNTAALGNYVWVDSNYNGLQDEPAVNGRNGVTVTLRNAADNAIIGTRITDFDTAGNPGYYTFTNLAAGSYIVCFEPPTGFALTQPDQPGTEATDSDANPATGCTAPVALAVGEVNPNVDAGLYQTAALGNYVWLDDGAAGGTARDGVQNEPAANGVNGITVTLRRASDNAVLGSLLTANDPASGNPGYYTFTNLVPGSYYVCFALPSGYVFTAPDQGGNETLDSDANLGTGCTISVTLASGEVNPNVDAGLFLPAPAIVLKKYTNDFDADTLTGPQVIIGSVVTWTYVITNIGNVGLFAVTLMDDIEGAVTCPSDQLAIGATMTCTKTGIAIAGQYTNTGVVTGTSSFDEQTQVTSTDPSHYFGSPLPPASLGNYVWLDANKDGVQNEPAANGINGITVTLRRTSDNAVLGTLLTSNDPVSGNPGYYTFTNLAPGSYYVCFALPGGYVFTDPDLGGNDTLDSDANAATGCTPSVVLVSNEANPTLDAGLFLPAPAIVLKKYTNGFDADVPTGPGLLIGSVVTWTYVITNTGNVALQDVVLTDDKIGPITCPKTSLVVGETMTCTVNGVAAAGQYANTGVVTGTNQLNPAQQVTSTDPSHYFGTNQPVASLGNFVWVDGDRDGQQDAGEPGIPGITVTLRNITGTVIATATTTSNGFYSFTNLLPGSYSVCFVLPPGTVLTDKGSDPTSDTDSNADPLTGCTALVTLAPGDNNPTIDTGVVVTAPSIRITKYTNGFDADLPPGPIVAVGSVVTWTYRITNTGDVTLTTVTLTDDKIGTITCPKTVLAPAEVMTCTRTGIAVAGQYVNTAVVTGTNQLAPAQTVTSTNPSHYFAAGPQLVIRKSSVPPNGTLVVSRTLITYTLSVTNTGDFTATGVIVDDPLPNDTTFVAGSAVPALQSGPTPLVWNVGTLGPGQSASVRFTVRVNDTVADPSASIQNQGGVRSNEIPRIPSNVIVHPFLPTAVELINFEVKLEGDALRIAWTTGGEVDTFGFAIYRSANVDGTNKLLVTSELVSAKGGNSTYSVVDATANQANRYYYWLQEVERSGKIVEYTPVAWVPQTAQAVVVNAIGVAVGGGVPVVAQVVLPAAQPSPASVLPAAPAQAQSAVTVLAQRAATQPAETNAVAQNTAAAPAAAVPETNAPVRPALPANQVAARAVQPAKAAPQAQADVPANVASESARPANLRTYQSNPSGPAKTGASATDRPFSPLGLLLAGLAGLLLVTVAVGFGAYWVVRRKNS